MSKCFGILVAAALVLLPANAWSDAAALATLDTDHDGTLDLAEAQSAASGIFSCLDGNHTGTLDPRELSGRLIRLRSRPPIMILMDHWTQANMPL